MRLDCHNLWHNARYACRAVFASTATVTACSLGIAIVPYSEINLMVRCFLYLSSRVSVTRLLHITDQYNASILYRAKKAPLRNAIAHILTGRRAAQHSMAAKAHGMTSVRVREGSLCRSDSWVLDETASCSSYAQYFSLAEPSTNRLKNMRTRTCAQHKNTHKSRRQWLVLQGLEVHSSVAM